MRARPPLMMAIVQLHEWAGVLFARLPNTQRTPLLLLGCAKPPKAHERHHVRVPPPLLLRLLLLLLLLALPLLLRGGTARWGQIKAWAREGGMR